MSGGPAVPGGSGDASDSPGDAERYFVELACAYVRGSLGPGAATPLPGHLATPPLGALTDAERAEVLAFSRAAELRIHRFKRTQGLPRVRKVLGILRGLAPATLLDIGTGRGVFLWPLLDDAPDLAVTCADVRADQVARIQAVRRGGISRLRAMTADVRALPLAAGSVDVVTALEVLEHLPDPALALAECLRVARDAVVVSVPSHEDDNPEHLHVLGPRELEAWARDAGATGTTVTQVRGHALLVARGRSR